MKVVRFDHDPRGLLEELPTKWENEDLRAIAVIAVDQNGNLIWEGAGYKNMELLWAIERFKIQILFGDKP